MKNLYSKLALIIGGILIFSPHGSYAQNKPVQMLPPTQAGSVSDCDSTGLMPQVLFYNVQAVANGTLTAGSAINCYKGFTLDPTAGNVTTNGSLNSSGVNVSGTGGININSTGPAGATGLWLNYSSTGVGLNINNQAVLNTEGLALNSAPNIGGANNNTIFLDAANGGATFTGQVYVDQLSVGPKNSTAAWINESGEMTLANGLIWFDKNGQANFSSDATTKTPTAWINSAGTVNATSYQANGVQAMTILGTVECLVPEGNGSVWMARNAHGTATGCSSGSMATCSVGTPTLIMVGHDLASPSELGGFCNSGNPANSCQTALFWCVN